MMLDAKRTFDELIERLAPDEQHARRGVRQPDLPAALERGGRLAGVHRDREALRARPGGRLRRAGARHAAVAQRAGLPRRARAADAASSRAARSASSCAPPGCGRSSAAAPGSSSAMLQRVTGVDLLRDLSVFFRSLGGMIDGFTERARRVGALLEDPATTFLIVTAPRHDPVEEAIFFHRKLREAGMPFGGLVVNRVHQPPDDALPDGGGGGARAGAGRARQRRDARAGRTGRPRRRERRSACATRSATRRRSSSPSSRTTCTTSRALRRSARTSSLSRSCARAGAARAARDRVAVDDPGRRRRSRSCR